MICFSESRIKGQPSLNLSIPNYIFLHVDSETHAGGVAMYIREILKFKICQKQHQLTDSEALWIKIDNLTEHSTTIGVVYRHPNSSTIDIFVKDLSCCITEFIQQRNILNT